MRVAVVGHVEWVTFARVERVPASGDIVHAREVFEVPAGGGAVAAVQLAKLAGACTFFTALGEDLWGRRAHEELDALGVRVEAAWRQEPQRRAFTYVDAAGERTITVMGPRLDSAGTDPLPWDELEHCDAVYFCAGSDDALRAARRARVLAVTLREHEQLARAGVAVDAVVGSARDPGEPWRPGTVFPAPGLVVRTMGAEGGTYETSDGRAGTYAAAPLPGPLRDSYGCGDSFAAGLTYALGAVWSLEQALDLAARCGAACLTGPGPYEGQLRS